ncbi:PAS domain S-box protein [Variovorax guangxiensis]|uniref:histidine kinase n=1 Tax=Variovorax guangxiensis TaxID=1775474 RepID=A0A502DS74_9BURK|nr:PAS domain S-box protein [Variovorax guangxiensis]RZI67879.1 MAG: PAS domain S-box protein [Variovorax sp.]TPG23012.1 PAS domain S-box protein [Variovorax ginsengisoli]TPG27560.1 PAS domain S-box protein [Variovorax guangxiensis]
MPLFNPLVAARSAVKSSPLAWWRRWWRRQTPVLQDTVAMLAPLAAVMLFLAAIVSAFWYLRAEEIEREQESVKRDVEYAQQRLRLRLLERQEQLMRVARDASNREIDAAEFTSRAESLISQYPELQAVSWIDDRRRFKANYAAPGVHPAQQHALDEVLRPGDIESNYALARELRQPVFSQPLVGGDPPGMLQLHIPLFDQGLFAGMVLGEFSVDSLLRYGVPPEVSARYAVSLLDAKGGLLAGNTVNPREAGTRLLPWVESTNEYEVPVSPIGNAMMLRAQAYRTSPGLVGNGLFWLVGALSVLTVWMLLGTWRHTRKRLQAQQALVAETNFRRAMENSMLTGMRVLDLDGRITYVNAAFCAMTGWSESELVGQKPPFPYWLESDREVMNERLEEELHGRALPGGFQVRVKRKNSSVFNARLYVSPLIDARGHQTGWMTSMTDITEPTRIREQLSASYERFTTVLEALDAAVSVAPIGSEELLFANKLYRLWFGSDTVGHLGMVAQAGVPASAAHDDALDDVDPFAGLPIDTLTTAQPANNEIFVPELGKWLEVRSRYLTWVDGRLAQLVIATDITPRRDAEEQAAAQADRAQAASRLITMGEMASSVAHELNQPLTAITNYCNGMMSRIKGQQIDSDALLAALEKTSKQAQRAGQIIQRIRSFVKRSEPNRTPAEVATMVSEAVELAGIELRRRNVRLNHYVAARLPIVRVDPILIEQVMVNLLKNAAESIDLAQRPLARRSVELRVLPKTIEGQNAIEFSVQDTGMGLAPEVMDRLYEAFFSTKAEGMGIGLNLCRTIVESHRGRMQAENIYNGPDVVGCRFSFWIPVMDASSSVANDEAKVPA